MVEAVHLQLCAEDGGGQAPGLELHRVDRRLPRGVEAGVPVAGVVGEGLDEGPAEGDVQHLDAAADAEDRHARCHRRVHQGELPGVALRVDCAARRRADLAVAGRVDVRPSAQHEAVDPLHERLDRGVPAQPDRQAARRGDRPGVVGEVQVHLGGPDRRGDVLAEHRRGPAPPGHADERWHGRRHGRRHERPLPPPDRVRKLDHRLSIVAGRPPDDGPGTGPRITLRRGPPTRGR